MKFTFGMWAAIFALSWIGPGLFFALAITGMAAAASISTGFSVQDKLTSPAKRKELW